MSTLIEAHKDQLTISSDPQRLDLDAVCDLLGGVFWAKDRSRAVIQASLEHSLVFDVYEGQEQVAMARVISDFATFAWVDDVIVREDRRGQGIGKWLMKIILTHPDLQGLRRWALVTRDAHGLYRQVGFTPLQKPERRMEILDPDAN
ncbi:MAG TPA: GNAT family N-acetyltransferase [Anaerolineales bacterium]